MPRCALLLLSVLFLSVARESLLAQLPMVRLLTVLPAGGKLGTQFEVTLTGLDLDEANQLHFSHPGIGAKQKLADGGSPEPGKFLVSIATNTPPAIYEGRAFDP